jgi:hypothetical protein
VKLARTSLLIFQDATDDAVSLADVDQGGIGATTAEAAAVERIKLEVVKRPEAKARPRASAEAMGGRKILCLGQRLPKPGQGSGVLHHNSRRMPRHCLLGFMLRHAAHIMDGA